MLDGSISGASLPEPEKRKSLFEESASEAHRHKWIESEKAGYDMGDAAVADWYRMYWRSFCRECYIEHLQGKTFWTELDTGDFGLLLCKFHDDMDLVAEIVDIFKRGGENLDVIQFALANDKDVQEIITLLEILNINARRIAPAVEITAKQFVESIRACHHPRCLIVEDDPSSGEMMRSVVEAEGMECVVCNSGEDALDEVQMRRFDLFLVDIMLPGKHGAEVAWYLKRHSVSGPVVAVSAALDSWTEDDLFDCGFTRLMAKPFDISELQELTREVRDDIINENS